MRLDINRLGFKNVVDLLSKNRRLYLEKENVKKSPKVSGSSWVNLTACFVAVVVSVANFYASLKHEVIFISEDIIAIALNSTLG